jgi:DNA-binding PucR family transcriptional regulator
VRERARRVGVDLAAGHAVAVLLGPAELRQRITAWAMGQAASHGGLAAYRDGSAVLLLPGEDPAALAARLAREARSAVGVPVTVGAAGPVRAPEDVAAAHREAATCAAALVALGRTGDGASGAELGFVGLLLGSGAGDVTSFVAGLLGPVLDYDRRRGTALCHTLAVYFERGGSPARTAEALHVHVNTVAQRLERLTSLLGAGWQRPERALDLQLALRLHRLSFQDTGR